MPFSVEKLEWCGYPTVEKFKIYFFRFDRMYERDRHTYTHTDGHRMTAKAALGVGLPSRGKNGFIHRDPWKQLCLRYMRFTECPSSCTMGFRVDFSIKWVNCRYDCRVLYLSDRRYSLNPLSQTRIDWVGRYRIRLTFKLSCVWH